MIPQDEAMVCVRVGCKVIWQGPQKDCPNCGVDGVTYKEVEDLAVMALPANAIDESKMLTTMIQ